MKVGLREAHQSFSKLIKAVRSGQQVTFTERGRPIARIVPITSPEDTEEKIQHMIDIGLLRPATKLWRMPPFKPRPIRGPSIVQTIREERDCF
jgi:prevent-host-death family protein